MNSGKYVVNWAGHGLTGTWGSADFFNLFMAPQLTNTNNLSIFTMLTCNNGQFQNTFNESLAEALLKANGGAVAAWASSGKTTPDVQEFMALRFYQQIGLGNITRLGDLIRDAKLNVTGATDARLTFLLIGDPMLKVR